MELETDLAVSNLLLSCSVLGSFMNVFSILISFLTSFSFIFVIGTKSKALRQYEEKKVKKSVNSIGSGYCISIFSSI